DLYFDGCVVPTDNVIVPAGGFRRLMEAFDLERCGNATMGLAQASGALEDVLAYVQERRQFGKPLVEFQAVQLRLAGMQRGVEAGGDGDERRGRAAAHLARREQRAGGTA